MDFLTSVLQAVPGKDFTVYVYFAVVQYMCEKLLCRNVSPICYMNDNQCVLVIHVFPAFQILSITATHSEVISMIHQQALCALSAVVSPIAASYGVEKLFLFGSRARGDARPDSDYDFLISKGKVQTLFLHAALWQALEDALNAPVDLITDTSSDKSVIEQARKEAILLYEQQGPHNPSENTGLL